MAPAQSRHWVFTLNNWTADDETRLEALASTVTYLVYGYETAETGTPHLQGYVCFSTVKRATAVKTAIGARAHVEVKRGSPKEASDYCKKEGLFKEFGSLPSGARGTSRFDEFTSWVVSRRDNDGPLPSDREIAQAFPELWLRHERRLRNLAEHLYPEPLLVLDDAELNDWQRVLHDALRTNDPGDRAILFYVDEEGGKGKTWFQRYMVSKYPNDTQVLSIGKRDDVAHALDQTKKIFLFNVPRGGMEFFQYTTVEQLKDRMVFSPKYDSKTKIWREKVHVVVFCNEEPDMAKMTADRYIIMNI